VLFTGTAGILSSSSTIADCGAGARSDRVGGGRQLGRGHRRPRCEPATAPIAADAKAAFSDATRLSAFTAGGFLVVGLLATIPLGRERRRDETDGAAVRAELRIGGDSRIPILSMTNELC
jgi:hypothetical protein